MLGTKLFDILIVVLLFYSCTQKVERPKNSIPIIYADYIFIEGNVDSIKGNFLLDTGADNLYIDNVFYEENDFRYTDLGNIEVRGIGNSIKKIPLINDSVNFFFGKYDYHTSNVPILELKPIGGDFIDGLFGIYFFKKNVLEINYTKNYMQVFMHIDSAKSINFTEYSQIQMLQVEDFFCIPLTFKLNDTNRITGNFFIDLGMPITTVTNSFAKKYNFEKNIERKVQYYTKYGGIGGESAGYDFISDSLTIGNFLLEEINMSYSLDEGGFLSEGEYIGILGNNILDKFDLIFDFDSKYLYIKPNKNFYEQFVFDKLGFTYVDRFKTKGAWIVTGLTKNSEAEKKLEIDDKIVSINGIPVEEIGILEQKKYFKTIDKAKISIKKGNKIKTVEINLTPLL